MQLTENFINNLEINNEEIIKKISVDLNIPVNKINNTIKLLKEDNTIPFISRYRKEVTGFLDEEQVRNISHQHTYLENIENRKIEIIKIIFERGLLTEDLYNNINKASNFAELEDIYAPYKKKKKTRAMIAIEKGLKPLAEAMVIMDEADIEKEAEKYIDEEKEINTAEDALQGAMDIIAEEIAHDIDQRKLIKNHLFKNALILVEGLKDADTSVYKMYYDYKEPINQIKPHRVLAINRGEKEKELKVTIDFDTEECCEMLLRKIKIANKYHHEAVIDGLKRLMIPSVTRELRSDASEQADDHGIGVFSKNLGSLLMQPPIKKTIILGIDPGIRTGSKGAILDITGKYLDYFVFFQQKNDEAKKKIKDAVEKYNVKLIAIGNGTGTHEVQEVVAEAINDFNLDVQYTVVDEDGASVYSASKIAREEFPDLDLTIRGAISIGRRLQDPLSELVKIDPKSIGVGLYQHDVNQTKLSSTLDEVVESVVNNVGVNGNTASFSLLKYVSGITDSIAKKIVDYRDKAGLIKSRNELKKISGIGDKVFEQSAGFIKIKESENPLDNTWVHPENYEVAEEIYKILKINKRLTSEDKKTLKEKHHATDTLINDILNELKKPNLDPRDDYPKPIFKKGIVSFENLKTGMKITGKVKNVVDFGAFIDIGIKETALLHISEISNSYIKSPHDVLKVGDVKEYTIIDIDETRKRISLSLKK